MLSLQIPLFYVVHVIVHKDMTIYPHVTVCVNTGMLATREHYLLYKSVTWEETYGWSTGDSFARHRTQMYLVPGLKEYRSIYLSTWGHPFVLITIDWWHPGSWSCYKRVAESIFSSTGISLGHAARLSSCKTGLRTVACRDCPTWMGILVVIFFWLWCVYLWYNPIIVHCPLFVNKENNGSGLVGASCCDGYSSGRWQTVDKLLLPYLAGTRPWGLPRVLGALCFHAGWVKDC